MRQPIAKLLFAFFVASVLLVVIAAVLVLSQPAPAPPPLPQPNGYGDFVQAGALIAGSAMDYQIMSLEELRALAARNQQALKLASVGLTRECRVPPDYSPTYAVGFTNLCAIKDLYRAFMATGRLAELEGRSGDAAEAYLTLVRLGDPVSRGGLAIDALVGLAGESMGLTGLEKLMTNLDAKQCRQAAVILESCEGRREPMAAIWARDGAWGRRVNGLKGRLAGLFTYQNLKQAEARAIAKQQSHEARTRRLMTDLAARAYELEKGNPPKSLTDLVPTYLKVIPQDPLTGTNMTYP